MSLLNELISEFIKNGAGNNENCLKIPTMYDERKFFCFLTKMTTNFVIELNDNKLEKCDVYHVSIVPAEPTVKTTQPNIFDSNTFLDEDCDSADIIEQFITKNKIICKHCRLGFVYKDFPGCWSCTERLSNNHVFKDNVCAICLSANDFFSIDLKCKHMFHSPCLYKLVNQSVVKCPVCRGNSHVNLESTKMLRENCPILNYGYFLDYPRNNSGSE